jgi:hypothetical protein
MMMIYTRHLCPDVKHDEEFQNVNCSLNCEPDRHTPQIEIPKDLGNSFSGGTDRRMGGCEAEGAGLPRLTAERCGGAGDATAAENRFFVEHKARAAAGSGTTARKERPKGGCGSWPAADPD